MDRQDTDTDLGTVRIHKNVIASIAAVASTEIEGVKRVGGNLHSGIMEAFGKKIHSSIRVVFDKNDEATLEIPLIIKYGFNIPLVADKVQENVRAALEKMTNLSIKNININVRGIERG